MIIDNQPLKQIIQKLRIYPTVDDFVSTAPSIELYYRKECTSVIP